jgi:hypothetical protein
MISVPSAEELRESLWEAYVYPLCSKRPETREEREAAALHIIQMSRHIALTTDDLTTRLSAASSALAIWHLLAAELGPWLIDAGSGLLEKTNDLHPRSQLKALLQLQNAGPPTHRTSSDPVALLIPGHLRDCLENAMSALDQGEVHTLVEPRAVQRHGDAWTWDQMRFRALEYVAFLCGQGLKKQFALRRVSLSMGMGSSDTLRDWEKTGSPLWAAVPDMESRLNSAREAGKILVDGRQDDDDANAVAYLVELGQESLEEFGQRYKQLFGGRTINRADTNGGD